MLDYGASQEGFCGAGRMLKTYSHIRRQALNSAAAALEPNFPKALAAEAELVN
jgi:hypothetical protein